MDTPEELGAPSNMTVAAYQRSAAAHVGHHARAVMLCRCTERLREMSETKAFGTHVVHCIDYTNQAST